METKKTWYSELAYIFGIIILAVGTAFMERADFGMSMVVAPAYLLHLKISSVVPAYTFGMSEYVFQAALIAALSIIMQRFKKSYLFSFITAVIYGLTLDLAITAIAPLPIDGLPCRGVSFLAGLCLCATGVAFLFHTYLSPEAYELFVKEVSAKTGRNINKVKTLYDWCSCLAAIIMSFAFFGFGRFEGIGAGTIICALLNGWLIGRIGSFLEDKFDFKDMLPYRKLFEQ